MNDGLLAQIEFPQFKRICLYSLEKIIRASQVAIDEFSIVEPILSEVFDTAMYDLMRVRPEEGIKYSSGDTKFGAFLAKRLASLRPVVCSEKILKSEDKKAKKIAKNINELLAHAILMAFATYEQIEASPLVGDTEFMEDIITNLRYNDTSPHALVLIAEAIKRTSK